MRISFSGHETFVCRQFWLKKGYEHLIEGHSFLEKDAVVHLGVGKNMTTAIRFWLKAFYIIDEDQQVTDFGRLLLTRYDPYLEDNFSLWLLHYTIISKEQVFIFHAFFNQFLKERNEFTKDHLISFLKRKTTENNIKLYSDKTYEADTNVFLRTYLRSVDGKADVEDETANLLIELGLIRPFIKENLEGKAVQWYRVIRENRDGLHPALLAYVILDRFPNQSSISFKELFESDHAPGNVFYLTERSLEDKLKELSLIHHNQFVYNETAGNRVLQINTGLTSMEYLNQYYDVN